MKNFLFFISIILILDLINCQDSQIDKETENEINSFISLNREGKLLSEQKFVQSDKPKISLIIPIYNEVNIMPTIRSIQNQNNQQIEIICIYDNSNDASLKLLKSLQKEDPRMFIIRNRSTRGILYDFIEGALDSNGEYVMFIYPGDFLSNAEALTKLYDMAVKDYNKKLDIVNFQACEIEIIGKKIKINSLISQIDKNNLTQVLKQPEIEDYYYNNMKNKKNEIIFDKLYSKRLIKRISNFIGPNIWNLNINFFHEYIINFANIMKSKSLVYVEDIFYWLITERLFDLTDKEPKSIQFKEALLRKIGDENILKALARSLYFDRYLNLFEKYIKWNLIDEDTKIRNQQFVKFILNFEVDIETKYGYIIEEEDDDDDEDDFIGYDYL